MKNTVNTILQQSMKGKEDLQCLHAMIILQLSLWKKQG